MLLVDSALCGQLLDTLACPVFAHPWLATNFAIAA